MLSYLSLVSYFKKFQSLDAIKENSISRFSVQAHQATVFCISAVMLCSETRRFCVCGSLFLASSASHRVLHLSRYVMLWNSSFLCMRLTLPRELSRYFFYRTTLSLSNITFFYRTTLSLSNITFFYRTTLFLQHQLLNSRSTFFNSPTLISQPRLSFPSSTFEEHHSLRKPAVCFDYVTSSTQNSSSFLILLNMTKVSQVSWGKSKACGGLHARNPPLRLFSS